MSRSPGSPPESSPSGVAINWPGWAFSDIFPCLDQPFAEVTAGLHQERAGTHCHVTDFQREDFPGRFELPLRLRLAFGGAEVDERLQRVLDDGLGEAARGVMGAGATAVAARGDINAALGNDDQLLEAVPAQQSGEGSDPLREQRVLTAGDEQRVPVKCGRLFDEALEGFLAATGFFVEEFNEGGGVLPRDLFELRKGNFRVGVLRAGEAEDRLMRALGRVVEETFVNVTDLLDVERTER